MKNKVSVLLLSGLLYSNVAFANGNTQVAIGKLPTVSIAFPDDKDKEMVAKGIENIEQMNKTVDGAMEMIIKPPHAMAGQKYSIVRIDSRGTRATPDVVRSKYGVLHYYIDIEVKNSQWKPMSNTAKKELERINRRSYQNYKDMTYTPFYIENELGLYLYRHATKFNLPNFRGSLGVYPHNMCEEDELNNKTFESDIKREIKYIMKKYNTGEVTNVNVYLEPPKEHEIEVYKKACILTNQLNIW